MILVLNEVPPMPSQILGSVVSIHISSAAGEPMRSVDRVRAIAGVGLEGDRYALGVGTYSNDARGGRHVTLIEEEVIEDLRRVHGIALAPGETRRNLVTRGVGLSELVGRRIAIGEILCVAIRLCEPCDYLADLLAKPVLRPLVHRGGLRTEVLEGGVIRVGDSLRIA